MDNSLRGNDYTMDMLSVEQRRFFNRVYVGISSSRKKTTLNVGLLQLKLSH